MPVYSPLLPRTQPRMSTPDTRVTLSHFLRQIEAAHIHTRTQRAKPLHFNSMIGMLSEYPWPCELNLASITPYDGMKRVAPCDLEGHRRTHRFRGPSCLCAFLDGKEYTEAQIAVVEVLTKDEDRNLCLLNGEFVAQCAEQRCGYLLCLERFYVLPDLPVHEYPRRENPLPLQDLVHISDVEKSFRRGDGLFQVMPDIVLRGNRRKLEKVDPKDAKAVNARLWDDLMAGMSEDAFWTTFVQCMECEKVTFRQHYAVNHRCSRKRPNHRHHPYRRGEDGRSTESRTLSIMDAVLVGDEPEARPIRSMVGQHRDSSPGSTYDYDPEDIAIPDEAASDCSSVCSDFETAQEEWADEELGLRSDYQEGQGAWWLHDAPELPSDDSLPDILTVIRGTARAQTSDVRTRVGSDEEASEVPLDNE